MGGMFGESKFDILKKIPPTLTPKSALVKLPATVEDVKKKIKNEGFEFPLIFKPDLGERGFMVKKISGDKDIDAYLRKIKIDFIIQDLLEMPLEFGVFYRRFPNDAKGEVTSIVIKEMLSVVGDGVSTLEQLVHNKDRAKLQAKTLAHVYKAKWHTVISDGEKIELVSVGNHCLGTKFIDGSHLISQKLSESFDRISKQVDGFYFGRFDLRCHTLADVENGVVKIMELNGCGAEPSHIYSPGFPMRKAMKVMYLHWKDMYTISIENKKKGMRFTSLKSGYRFYKDFKKATTP